LASNRREVLGLGCRMLELDGRCVELGIYIFAGRLVKWLKTKRGVIGQRLAVKRGVWRVAPWW
jgi:hypothetical protein